MEFAVINREFSDINPVSAGCEECKAGHKFGPYVRNYFLIHYVVKGNGTFTNSKGTYKLKKGDIFIITPGEITSYRADEQNPWEYIWIGFTGRLSERMLTLNSPVMPYGENTFFEIRYAERLKNTREEFLAGKAFEILSVLFESDGFETDYVKQAQDYINACFMTEITAESVAHTIGLSRRYLSRLFKARTGGGLQSFIIKTRVENAKKLLKSGESVQNTATLSGFADMFNFSKTFKKETGFSPSDYKKHIKNE